jgi:hypothetical protein
LTASPFIYENKRKRLVMLLEIINIEKVQLFDFKKIYYGTCSCSLRIGEILELIRLIIFFSPIKQKFFLKSFPSNTFIDRQLDMILQEGVLEFCNKEVAELSSFCNNDTDKFSDSPLFTPKGLERPLMLCVDSIELDHIMKSDYDKFLITAKISIGKYFVFYGVPIYDQCRNIYLEPKIINNQPITEALNKLIRTDRVKKRIDSAATWNYE